MISDPEKTLRTLFDVAVAAARTRGRLGPFLPHAPAGRTIVIGAGKAAAEMAAAFDAAWTGPLTGLVVTRKGHAAQTGRIKLLEAAHPVPDEASANAARDILALAQEAGPDDLVICLLSGGASSLLFAPLPAIPAEDKRSVCRKLLASGATIAEFNCVRRHLSAIKGGRLALAAYPAKIVTLAVSDVVGDRPEIIGSGPTSPDPTTLSDASAILKKFAIEPGPAIRAILADPANETPKLADFARIDATFHLVASPRQSLAAAETSARELGIEVINLGDAIEGEASLFGVELARKARAITAETHTGPVLLLSGGELTVTVSNPNGRGGPNAECALGFTGELAGAQRIYGLFADTDGIDGSEDNAGALVTPSTFYNAMEKSLDWRAMLADNLGYDFFKTVDGLLMTGPTLTNVNDFRAVLIMPADAS